MTACSTHTHTHTHTHLPILPTFLHLTLPYLTEPCIVSIGAQSPPPWQNPTPPTTPPPPVSEKKKTSLRLAERKSWRPDPFFPFLFLFLFLFLSFSFIFLPFPSLLPLNPFHVSKKSAEIKAKEKRENSARRTVSHLGGGGFFRCLFYLSTYLSIYDGLECMT